MLPSHGVLLHYPLALLIPGTQRCVIFDLLIRQTHVVNITQKNPTLTHLLQFYVFMMKLLVVDAKMETIHFA